AVLVPLALVVGAGEVRDHDTLQDLLLRLRASRDGVVNEMRARVDSVLASMEQDATSRSLDALESEKKSLVALGPEVATLLVDTLDPGTQSTDAQKLRSQYVTLVLSELKSRAILQRVIDIAQSGSVD